jgi:hypothetical protein
MNDGAARLFVGWTKSEPVNLLQYVFLDVRAQTLISDWADRALRVIAEFRPGDVHVRADPRHEARHARARSVGLRERHGLMLLAVVGPEALAVER